MRQHPCMDCGEPIPITRPRCEDCTVTPLHNFGTRHNPAYDSRAYRRLRSRVITQHKRLHGMTCPGYRRPPHTVTALELDHVTPLAQGGSLLDPANAAVLCPSCNRAKSGR